MSRKTISASAVTVALVLAALLAPVASAETCGSGTYAYAGVWTKNPVLGVAATIETSASAHVRNGHVAGWVGVASANAGPDGTGTWIQVGLDAFPGDGTARIYYEVKRPYGGTTYRELAAGVPIGQLHQFTIAELPEMPNRWQASVDGVPVGPVVYMPRGQRGWRAQVLGESWAGNSSGWCNDYAYSFGAVSVLNARSSAWALPKNVDAFQDAGYMLIRNSPGSFVAASTSFARRALR